VSERRSESVSGTAVIQANALVKRYGTLVAADQVSLEVQRGEVFGMLGPNGAGKTTTLEMLEGMRVPDSGEATVLGVSIRRDSRAIKERIGVQLQASALPLRMTVREVVELFGSFYSTPQPTDAILEEFDLVEKAQVYSETLSGGQQQRLSIALALVNDPELVFLDEPTTGLDPQARLNIWDVIEGLRTHGKTVMLTTHYMEEAERLCDRVAIMDHGRIVAIDTPAALVAAHAPGTSIEFTASGADLSKLRALAGVSSAEHDGNRVVLHTDNAEDTLAALFGDSERWGDADGGHVADLRVRQGTLEDVFIALTGRTLRE